MIIKDSNFSITNTMKCDQKPKRVKYKAESKNLASEKLSQVKVFHFYENKEQNCCFNYEATFTLNKYPLTKDDFENILENKLKPLIETTCEAFSRRVFELDPR